MSVLKNKNANSRDRTHIDKKEKSHANSREEKSEREQFQRSDTYPGYGYKKEKSERQF